MAVILYRQDTGAPITFVHAVDARESMRSGGYSASPPSEPKKPIVPEKAEAKVTATPIVVEKKVDPTVEEKKVEPIVIEAKKVELIAEKIVDEIKEEKKSPIKPSPRIIRK